MILTEFASVLLAAPALLAQDPTRPPEGMAWLDVAVVAEADGKALPGAVVSVYWSRHGGPEARMEEASGPAPHGTWSQATCDAGGRCRLELPARKLLLLYVEPTADTWRTKLALEKALAEGTTTPLTLRARPRGVALAGLVRDPEGNAVEGATVSARLCSERGDNAGGAGIEAFTDSSGGFLLEGLRARDDAPQNLYLLLSASAPGSVAVRRAIVDLDVCGSRIEGMHLSLGPARTLHGRVANPAGAPVAGAKVQAGWGGWRGSGILGVSYLDTEGFEAETDAGGEFVVEGVARARLPLSVSHADYQREELVLGASETEVDVRMRSRLAITGRVLSPDGVPVAGAKATIYRWGTFAETGADGWFRLENLDSTRGRVLLEFYAPGYALQAVWPVPLAEGADPLEVVLAPEKVIAGRVRDASGKAVAGAQISVHFDWSRLPKDAGYARQQDLPEVFGLDSATTDVGGRFRFGSMNEGWFTLRVAGGDPSHPGAVLPVEAGNEAVEIVLGAGFVRLHGQVLDALTRTPIARCKITPVAHGSNSIAFDTQGEGWTDDEDGHFHFDGLEAGTWSFRAEADGYPPQETRLQEYAEGQHEVEVLLYPARQLDLRVLDAAGRPASFAILDMVDPCGHSLGSVEFPLGITDASGMATLKDLPGGPVELLVTPPLVATSERFPLDLREPAAAPVEVHLALDVTSTRRTVPVALRRLEAGADLASAVPLDVPCTLRGYNEQGQLVTEWDITPFEGRWHVTKGHPLVGLSVPLMLRQPVVPFLLPMGTCRVVGEAEGFRSEPLEAPAHAEGKAEPELELHFTPEPR